MILLVYPSSYEDSINSNSNGAPVTQKMLPTRRIFKGIISVLMLIGVLAKGTLPFPSTSTTE